jgi:hypothetical protein
LHFLTRLPGSIIRALSAPARLHLDFLTFFVMLGVLHASRAEFRSGWFVESLAPQTLSWARQRRVTTHEQRLAHRIRRRAGLFIRHEFAHLCSAARLAQRAATTRLMPRRS